MAMLLACFLFLLANQMFQNLQMIHRHQNHHLYQHLLFFQDMLKSHFHHRHHLQM